MNEIFSNRLKELRLEARISQRTLANVINATQKAIEFWEKGINEPKLSFLIKLAQFFNVSIDYLAGLED